MKVKFLGILIIMLSLVSYGKESVSTEKVVNTYSNNKILLKRVTYKDGYLNGPYMEYYADGKVKVQGEYYMGLKVNDWFEYSPDGKLIYQAKYFDGLPVGPAYPIKN